MARESNTEPCCDINRMLPALILSAAAVDRRTVTHDSRAAGYTRYRKDGTASSHWAELRIRDVPVQRCRIVTRSGSAGCPEG